MISLFIFILFMAMVLLGYEKTTSRKLKLLVLMFMLSILPTTYLSVKYCILRPEFHYRDACIALDRIIGNKAMAGVWSDGYRLYTSGNVFFPWNPQPDLEKHKKGLIDIFEKKLADYTVSFSTGDFIDIPRDVNAMGKSFLLQKVAILYLGKGSLQKSLIVYKRINK